MRPVGAEPPLRGGCCLVLTGPAAPPPRPLCLPHFPLLKPRPLPCLHSRAGVQECGPGICSPAPRSQVTAPHAPQPMWRVSTCEHVHVGCVYVTQGPQDLHVCPAPLQWTLAAPFLGSSPHGDRVCHELPVCFTSTTLSPPPFLALRWESDISVILPPPARQAPLAASWGPGAGAQEPVGVRSDCSAFFPGVFPFPRGDPAHVRTAAEQPEGVEGPGR